MTGLLELVIEFFKLGLFAYGGGLAVLAMIQDVADELNWLTSSEFADVIAISQSTPGPIGINLASFVGYLQEGIPGAILSSFSVILPGVIFSLILARFLHKFNEEPAVKNILLGLRAVIVGLLGKAIVDVSMVSIFNQEAYERSNQLVDLIEIKSLALFGVILFLVLKFDKHPIIYIIGAGIIGVIIY